MRGLREAGDYEILPLISGSTSRGSMSNWARGRNHRTQQRAALSWTLVGLGRPMGVAADLEANDVDA